MPPKKTIIVDKLALLKRIASVACEVCAQLDAEIATEDAAWAASRDYYAFQHAHRLRQERESIEQYGIRYDLPRFADRELTPSERIRHQQAMREMERNGLIVLEGAAARSVKLTAAGRAAMEAAGP